MARRRAESPETHLEDPSAEHVPELEEDEAPRAPWHFKVLLFGTVGYLVYRLVWFVFWLNHHAWHG